MTFMFFVSSNSYAVQYSPFKTRAYQQTSGLMFVTLYYECKDLGSQLKGIKLSELFWKKYFKRNILCSYSPLRARVCQLTVGLMFVTLHCGCKELGSQLKRIKLSGLFWKK